MDIKNKNFYCPWCKISFGLIDRHGRAICPICRKFRSDNLNQIDVKRFSCLKCGCNFTNVIDGEPKCPNDCASTGGISNE